MEKKKTNTLLWIIGILLSVLVMALAGNIILESTDSDTDQRNNFTINGVDLSGLTRVQAVEALSRATEEQADLFNLTLNYKDKSWEIHGKDFEINSDIYTIIDEAQRRSLISSDFEESRNFVEGNSGDLTINFEYLFVGLSDRLDEIISEVTIDPIDARVIFDHNINGHVIIEDEVAGTTVDKNQLYTLINEGYQRGENISISLPMIPTTAKITKEDLLSCTDNISNFSTSVSDSTGNRKYNVSLALSKFDGMMIEPYETISFNKVTGPHTQANGYKVATIIYEGKFQDGVGGGICQASSTLYNALLLAGRNVSDVQKHTLPVKYVPLGLDAMVSASSDLVFTNNSEYPMFVHTYSDSEKVYVELYGKSLGDVSYKTRSEQVRIIKAEDRVVLDTKGEYSSHVLYKGEKYRISYPKDGYEVKSYLDKYENGELVDSTLLRHDTYSATAGLVVEGALDMPDDYNN